MKTFCKIMGFRPGKTITQFFQPLLHRHVSKEKETDKGTGPEAKNLTEARKDSKEIKPRKPKDLAPWERFLIFEELLFYDSTNASLVEESEIPLSRPDKMSQLEWPRAIRADLSIPPAFSSVAFSIYCAQVKSRQFLAQYLYL